MNNYALVVFVALLCSATGTDFRRCNNSSRRTYPAPKSLTIQNCPNTPCRFDDGYLDFTVEFVTHEEVRDFRYFIVVTRNFPSAVYNLPESCGDVVGASCPLKPNETVRSKFRRYVDKVKYSQGHNQTVEISIQGIMCFEIDAVI